MKKTLETKKFSVKGTAERGGLCGPEIRKSDNAILVPNWGDCTHRGHQCIPCEQYPGYCPVSGYAKAGESRKFVCVPR